MAPKSSKAPGGRRTPPRTLTVANLGDCTEGEVRKILDALASFEALAPQPPYMEEPVAYRECAPPDLRTPPHFLINFREPLPHCYLIRDDIDLPAPSLSLACTQLKRGYQFILALDLRYTQLWNFLKLGVGDLSSTLGLAPGEKLVLEFETTQRRVLEQEAVDEVQLIQSTESVVIDKEVLNVSRASSKTKNWKIDGNGTFSLGKIGSFSLGGSVSETIQSSSQSSLEHISESTVKSSEELKTLHKVRVRGVSEVVTESRMTRTIRNPYRDRTLSISVFELLKHFCVRTALAEVRPALVLAVTGLEFDDRFVVSNSEFLRENLLDPLLVEILPIAIEAARPSFIQDLAAEARELAKLALRYLFDEPDLFGVRPVETPLGANIDANVPDTSFHASHLGNVALIGVSGLDDALANQLGQMFLTINMIYRIYRELSADELDERAISLVKALSSAGKPFQAAEGESEQLKNLFDQSDLTEIFRRMPGFLAIEADILGPLLERIRVADPDKAQSVEDGRYAMTRILEHLDCHTSFYIQRYLPYLASKTNNQAIVELVRQAIRAKFGGMESLFEAVFDIERSFIDRQDIVTTARRTLRDEALGAFGGEAGSDFASVEPQVIFVEVPCDGIHLEASAGRCILDDVPGREQVLVDLRIGDGSLKVEIEDETP